MAEFGAFAAMGLIAGRCGTTAAAGHAIIQCLTDLSYVLPLGIGALGSVQVGQGVGGGGDTGPFPTTTTNTYSSLDLRLDSELNACFLLVIWW